MRTRQFSPSTNMPLPLSAFEHYMLMDDSSNHPMVFSIRLTIDGTLNRNWFESAVAQALQRHPLLNSTVRRSGHDVEWIESTSTDPTITWNPDQSDSALRPIDLEIETGLRILVNEFDESCRVTIQLHHACCDAIGAMQFIDDVLIGMHNRSIGSPETKGIAHCELDTTALIERAKTSRKRSRWSVLYRLPMGIWRSIRFLVRQPVALTGRDQTGLRSQDSVCKSDQQPPCIDRTFDSSVLRKLRERAAANSVTLNDYLLTLLFETLCDWNAKTSGSQSGLVRVGIPINLRTPRHEKVSAANVVTMSYVDRTGSQTKDSNRLLSNVSRQMDGIKSRKSEAFVRLMQHFRKQPRLQRLISSDRVFQTAIFSNVGRILTKSPLPRTEDNAIRFGDAVLQDVDIYGPIRSTMSVFFIALCYAGRLKACLAYDATKFRPGDAAELHDELSRRITSINSNDDTPDTTVGSRTN